MKMSKLQNPIKIQIKGASAGHDATEWCSKNLAHENWEMWIGNDWSHYIFEFTNKEDATIFALKWGHFA
jgi:hypothetical protein